MPKTDENRTMVGDVHAIKSLYAARKPLWVYIIEGSVVLWVDVGINSTPSGVIFPYLMNYAPRTWGKTQLALITHADVDHFGGLRALKGRRPDALVLAHGADKPWIESPALVMRQRYLMHEDDGISLPPERQAILAERGGGGGPVDIALTGGEALNLGTAGTWTVLHVPGHSAGHLALWNEERRWAIIGDAALEWGVPNDSGELIAAPPYYDVDAYVASVKLLRDLRAEQVFTSHYGIFDAVEADAFYERSLAAVDLTETTLAQVLAKHPDGLALADLCTAVGRAANHWQEALWPGLADPLSAHLERLIRNGRVERVAADGKRLYRSRKSA